MAISPCMICGNKTLFYVWTTTRNFPMDRLLKKMNITEKREIERLKLNGREVCYKCYDELKEE